MAWAGSAIAFPDFDITFQHHDEDITHHGESWPGARFKHKEQRLA